MDNIIYILFICIVVPLLLMLGLLEKKSRLTIGFMIIGIFMCLFAAELNGFMRQLLNDKSLFYITTTITPVTEEIVKALPVLFFAFVISDKREQLISISMAVGIGFAILENTYILVNDADSVSVFWALVRGLGAGLMHGICTAAIGIGISFVHKKKKLFYTGTFALLSTAVIYHAIYNSLVQSDYKYLGFLLPVLTYIPIIIALAKSKKKQSVADDKSN